MCLKKVEKEKVTMHNPTEIGEKTKEIVNSKIEEKPTWFALEGQDSFDPRLFVAIISISVHESDVISSFSLLGR